MTLEEAAIEEDTFTVGFEEVHRASCGLCRAVECEFHDGEYYTIFRGKSHAPIYVCVLELRDEKR